MKRWAVSDHNVKMHQDLLLGQIAELGADRESGATELLHKALAILGEGLGGSADVVTLARALCRAQPAMAPFWNAAILAVSARSDAGRFVSFAERVRRAPHALRRFAAEAFGDEDGPLRVATISFSRSVVDVLEAVAERRSVQVSCAESRPLLEGRRLAEQLVASGFAVDCYADAAMGEAVANADVVIVGADAVSADWVLNKAGTRLLASTATLSGVPVYVAATREKFVGAAVASRLHVREQSPDEVWKGPPAGVGVRNPYFDRTPLDLVTTVISDIGLLGTGMVPDVCRSLDEPALAAALEEMGLVPS